MEYKEAETKFEYIQEKRCPRCNTGISPIELKSVVHYHKDYIYGKNYYATVMNFCPVCQNCFITTYTLKMETYYEKNEKLFFEFSTIGEGISSPKNFIGKTFPKNISDLSPCFVETYNQSEYAEQSELTQIAGMGYRKALEFLVKDYAIHISPAEKSKIEPDFLAHCIKEHIDNPKIKTLAEKSAWLGNDESHYNKTRANENLSVLKSLIDACANYIEMELTVEKADTIQRV